MKKIRMGLLLILAATALLVLPQDALTKDQAPLKVAIVFDIGGRGDGGFNDAAYRGMERAVVELGIKALYIEHKRNLELETALNEAAASDVEMIIGVGFAFSDKLNRLAPKYPTKKFVCIDYSVKHDEKGRTVPLPSNLAGLLFKEEEGSYLVGAIAALTSRSGQIGFIGGMDNPIIRKFQAGYLAGVKAVRPDIRVSSQFSGITGQAFNDPQKGYEIATRMYKDGTDIIYHAAGITGSGLFRAAKEMNGLAIGVDIDQSAQAPGQVLTSMTKNIDVAVFESVKACISGKFSGGLHVLGLKENGVGFVYNEQNRKYIKADVYDRVIALKAQISAGKLAVPAESQQKAMLSEKDLKDVLAQLSQEITAVMQKLDGDLQRYAKSLSGTDLKGESARGVLKELYGTHPYIIDCETVSSSGIMLAVEPSQHRSSEGADISAQAHMVKLFKIHKPVLSHSFRSVEGPEAVVIHHPVFSPERRFAGSVSALFAPEYILANIVGPVSSNLPIDIFLMQTDGKVIYDADTKQIGMNVFTDPFYQPFPELIALARKVAAEQTGTGVYRFYQKGTGAPTAEVAYWRTVALHGTQWRIVITCAQDNVVK